MAGHRAADDAAARGPLSSAVSSIRMKGLRGSHVMFLLSTWAVVSFLALLVVGLAWTLKLKPQALADARAQRVTPEFFARYSIPAFVIDFEFHRVVFSEVSLNSETRLANAGLNVGCFDRCRGGLL